MTEISTKLATYTVFCACVLDQIGILGTGDKRRVPVGTRKRNNTEET